MSQIVRKLNNGLEVPAFGIGTWQSPKNEVREAVKCALKLGYRHVDAAWIYGNEEEVGEALQDSFSDSLKRGDIFITSKLWNTKHHPDDVRPAIEDTLRKLQTDYLDLYLIHWPMDFLRGENKFPFGEDGKVIPQDPPISLQDTWKAMEALVDAGLTKSIGVSNFTVAQLQEVLDIARVRPVVNQIECHPYLQQNEIVEFCKQHDILITAYSPLGNPTRPEKSPDDPLLLEDAIIQEIATRHNKTPAQVLIRWQLERGHIVIPKSTTPSRIEQNMQVFDFALTPEDMQQIASMDRHLRCVPFNASSTHPKYPF